jgi:hypothetical protein
MLWHTLILGLTSLLLLAIIIVSKFKKRKRSTKARYSQSSIHEVVKDLLPKKSSDKLDSMTQSRYHAQKNMMKVIVTDGMAYWVVDNVFYSAKSTNGRIDSDTVSPLDVDSMSKKELNKMLIILDALKGGEDLDDNSSSRN